MSAHCLSNAPSTVEVIISVNFSVIKKVVDPIANFDISLDIRNSN